MKYIAKTTGDFMVFGIQPDATVPHDRPGVVGNYPHIARAIASGTVTTLASDVPDHVTDEDFAKAYAEAAAGKKDFDVNAFVKAYLAKADKAAPREDAPAPAK